MSKRITRLAIALAAAFAVLLVQLTNLGYFSASDLRHHDLNRRAAAAALGQARGAITTMDGESIAPAIDAGGSDERRLRTYPHGRLYAHIAGFLSPAAGASGLERSYDAELSGSAANIALRDVSDLFTDSDRVGNLLLSVHHGVQITARAALGDRDGAVVVVDPGSGAVIALWSRPSFDPNAVVNAAPGSSLASHVLAPARAYQRHYRLASDAALSSASEALLEGARRRSGTTGIDLPSEPERAELDRNEAVEGQPLTPLQLALAAASVANGGLRMRPFVVHTVSVRSASLMADGQLAGAAVRDGASWVTTPQAAGRLFEPAEAADLLARMSAEAPQAAIGLAPTDGTGTPAALAIGRIEGPDGDPEPGGGWAVLLAPAEAPTVAVAVLIEGDAELDVGDPQRSGTLAAMIAATAAEAALALRAVPTPVDDGP